MKQFHGSLDELKAAVGACGLQGDWSERPESGLHSFRARSGEILNWWPSKGTLQFQGKNPDAFRTALSSTAGGATPVTPVSAAASAKIFVVHGHDRDARDQLELILMRLGLRPFILQNSDGQSKTIIEALEQNIYREAAFGIILLTPDDFGYSKAAGETEKQPRARQNVILEMGMVMAALSRSRMVILKKGALEMPSDAAGILYIEFNDHVREIVPKLAQRLQGAGFQIDPRKIAEASS
ncbi:MAG: nucleotide-binding protein [Rhodospirillales bacterium]|jgi:predicted nucleotide-binding protein|nr:nucleotide-binding protein [Rhodospirillales bacterium]